jgi:hypothetical protein
MNDIGVIRWLAAGGLLLGLVAAAGSAAAQGSPEQRKLCGPEAVRLCKEFVPNVEKVTECMTAKKAELSAACRNVMFGASKSAAPAKAPEKAASAHTARAKAKAERRAAQRTERAAERKAEHACKTPKGHTKKHYTCKAVRTRG